MVDATHLKEVIDLKIFVSSVSADPKGVCPYGDREYSRQERGRQRQRRDRERDRQRDRQTETEREEDIYIEREEEIGGRF
jgi:hypothetical protein